MKILITSPSLDSLNNVSGVSTVVNTIIKYNKEHVFFHYLLGRSDKRISKILWFAQLLKQILLFPLFILKNKIDLVHQNLPFDHKGVLREFVINLYCRLLGIPVLLHIHGGVFLMNGTPNVFYNFLAKSLFRHSEVVVVLSVIEKETLKINYQYPSALVLLNSVDSSLFFKIKHSFQHDKPVILFLGRIHESKGIEEIVSAFRTLKKVKDFRFILCGDGPLRKKIIEDCNSILGTDFEYRGVVTNQHKLDVISESDYFILPSRYGEGLPMALLETMAAGVVPIVSDDASMRFVVQHELNGIRVKKNNSIDLSEKLLRVLSNHELYEILSTNARNTIIEKYDIKNFILELNRIYASIEFNNRK